MKIVNRTTEIAGVSTREMRVDGAIRMIDTVTSDKLIKDVYCNTCGKVVESITVTDRGTGDTEIVRYNTELTTHKTTNKATIKKSNDGIATVRLNDNEPVDINYEATEGRISRHDIIPNIRSFVNVAFPEAPSSANIDITYDTPEAGKIDMTTSIKLQSGALSSDIRLEVLPISTPVKKTLIKSIKTEFSSGKTEMETPEEPRLTNVTYDASDDATVSVFDIDNGNATAKGRITRYDDNSIYSSVALDVKASESSHIDTDHHVTFESWSSIGNMNMNVMSFDITDDGIQDTFTLIYNDTSLLISSVSVNGPNDIAAALLDSRKLIQTTIYSEEEYDIKYMDPELDFRKLFALIAYGSEFLDFNCVGRIEQMGKRIEDTRSIAFHMNNYRRLGNNKKRAVFIENTDALCTLTRDIATSAGTTEIVKSHMKAYAGVLAELVLSCGGFIGSKTMPCVKDNIACVVNAVL